MYKSLLLTLLTNETSFSLVNTFLLIHFPQDFGECCSIATTTGSRKRKRKRQEYEEFEIENIYKGLILSQHIFYLLIFLVFAQYFSLRFLQCSLFDQFSVEFFAL